MMTGFTRIIIVLSLLRSGASAHQSSPPNQVLVGLALFLTFFVMAPVFDKMYADAYLPYSARIKITFDDSRPTTSGSAPLKDFMLQARRARPTSPCSCAWLQQSKNAGRATEDVPLRDHWFRPIVTSELKTAFQIGFVVFIPFLIIDMVVASVLMSMGMMMLSPVLISLPFKLMLFVLVDGWNLIIASLVTSFGT